MFHIGGGEGGGSGGGGGQKIAFMHAVLAVKWDLNLFSVKGV